MANVRDIAQQLGLSVATVSRVLNHRENVALSTRERVLACFQELQYAPDGRQREAIRRGKYDGLQKRICHVLCGQLPEDPGCAGYLSNLINACAHSNNQLVIVHTREDAEEWKDLPAPVRKKHCDGVILYGYLTAPLTARIAELGLPGVVIGSYPAEVIGSFSNILPDIESMVAGIASKLWACGVRDAASVVECPDNYANREYLRWFESAAVQQGMRLRPENRYAGKKRMGGILEELKPVFRQRELPFDGVFAIDERIAREVDKLNFMRAELFGVAPVPVATIRLSYHSGYEKTLISPNNRNQDHEVATQSVAVLLEAIQALREGKTPVQKTVLV